MIDTLCNWVWISFIAVFSVELVTIPLRLPPCYCIRTIIRNVLGICMDQKQNPFWETKTLKEMTKVEWESLCDRCGLCCLYSVQDWKTGKIKLLAVACQYLDISTCRCVIYKDRFNTVPDCTMLSPDKIRRIKRLSD